MKKRATRCSGQTKQRGSGQGTAEDGNDLQKIELHQNKRRNERGKTRVGHFGNVRSRQSPAGQRRTGAAMKLLHLLLAAIHMDYQVRVWR